MPDIKRKCNSCGLEATTEEQLVLFMKEKTCKHGRANLCVECNKKRSRSWFNENKTEANQKHAEYKKENRGLYTALENKRRAAKLRATPKWANHAIIKDMYVIAARRGQHVDHIVPLKNGLVCGLHCEDNLQLLDPAENLSKGNRFNV